MLVARPKQQQLPVVLLEGVRVGQDLIIRRHRRRQSEGIPTAAPRRPYRRDHRHHRRGSGPTGRRLPCRAPKSHHQQPYHSSPWRDFPDRNRPYRPCLLRGLLVAGGAPRSVFRTNRLRRLLPLPLGAAVVLLVVVRVALVETNAVLPERFRFAVAVGVTMPSRREHKEHRSNSSSNNSRKRRRTIGSGSFICVNRKGSSSNNNNNEQAPVRLLYRGVETASQDQRNVSLLPSVVPPRHERITMTPPPLPPARSKSRTP
mmetsp:Transcript_8941/g.18957  ORF Transcript_8941/g.18957 Transcript_8941/m.18957 type:complete len:259 (-) Transcript_8941:2136-2912(-)